MTFPGIFPMTFFAVASAAPPAGGIFVMAQPYEITLAATEASKTATIASAAVGLSVIFPASYTYDNVNAAPMNSSPETTLTDATTVTVDRTGTVGSVTARGTVVTFNSTGVESVEYGAIVLGSAVNSNTATITSANVSRTAIFNLGLNGTLGTSTLARYYNATVQLTDPTTITAVRNDSLTNTLGRQSYCLVRFQPNVATVQHRLVTTTSAGLTETDAITSAAVNSTFLAWGGNRGDSGIEQDFMMNLQLASPTGVLISRGEGGVESRTVAYNVVQIAPAYVAGVQRGVVAVSGAATQVDAAITSANTSKSALTWCGNSTLGDQPNEQATTLKLLNATTVRAQKGAAGVASDIGSPSWEVVTFV